ncbi:alpha/beta hydrolase [Pseudoduganella namucuonensis]|uniref:Acyl-CoA:diacylglycerol acyltransferase n=1 Tax=Pseudoduganella namucuonensis TaxID=1035707 RepID=A0A1I7GV94_9BURK|nr:alpha/beta hydrolase-fold protein [Pseudoduganella namucuonensis]SFU52360.1 Tat (twin-arginine translocation) pathway signal sequence [Pseudoduganella namucuonensis]
MLITQRRNFLKTVAVTSLAAGCAPAAFAATPATPAAQPKAGGRFVDYEPFAATEAAPRRVRVWLPPGYDAGKERYAVLYMHDGQNLFDPADSVQWGAWDVDRHLVELARQNKVRPTIVVGVWNLRENRGREYLPQAPVMSLPAEWRGEVAAPNPDGASAPLSDAYLRFLVKELKPFVDANFRTRSGRADTFVMGASMGGLISLYALASYPEVFGGAGCVSTHWPMTTNGKLMQPSLDPKVDQIAQAYRAWLAKNLPAAGGHKLYFDHGTVELDSLYPPFQAKVDELLREKGYRQGVDWITRPFPGTAHNETVWRARLAIPLEFLLKPA